MKKIFIAFLAAICLFNSCFAEEVVDEAILHLDKPYRRFAEGPNSFDCSGFVYYCFKEAKNIEIPRTAKGQGYNDEYEKIENIEDLMIGDAVYFNTVYDRDLCDHAGIYVGNGDFIHCSSSKRKVLISSLLNGYYNKHFSWGRRIINKKVEVVQDD